METSEAHAHVLPYGTAIKVWGALLVLTAILVFLSEWQHELLSVWAMLIITPIKAGLVLWYFMHLKYESTLLKGMLFIALGSLVIFIGLMFLDVSFR